MNFLEKVVALKRDEVARAKAARPLTEIMRALETAPPPRRLLAALRGRRSIIAEIKRASPSAGFMRADLDAAYAASCYQRGGASAVSVLTDGEYFSGSLADLEAARRACSLPLLRKDFLIDEYQLAEARLAGADAMLLIVTLLGDRLAGFIAAAARLGLDALVEVHDTAELQTAVAAGAKLIGVNNRDLKTLKVDARNFARVVAAKPAGVTLVAESGVSSPAAARRAFLAGADAILVGSHLVTSPDPLAALRLLTDVAAQPSV